MERTIEIPAGLEVVITPLIIKVVGPKGKVERARPLGQILIEKKENKIVVSSKQENARAKAIVGAYDAHIKNMIAGVQELYIYKLKICNVHFPISAKVSGQELLVSNFLGEKTPRKVKLNPEVQVKVEGEIITVVSADKELAGQVAARIENATRLSNKDRRIFQDGIYMIEKAGKKI